jgi:hypothetical protein
LALLLGPAGAAWVGVKVSLNGTVERVRRIESKVDGLEKEVSDLKLSVGRLQGHNDAADRAVA